MYLLDALTCTSKNEAGAAQKRTGSLTNVHKTTNGSDSFGAKDELNGKTYSDAQDVFTSPLMNGTDHVYTDSFNLNVSGNTSGGDDLSALKVNIRIVMNAQGAITAYLKNDDAITRGNKYRLMLTVDAREGSAQSDEGQSGPTTNGDDTTESASVTRYSYVTWGNPKITKDTGYVW